MKRIILHSLILLSMFGPVSLYALSESQVQLTVIQPYFQNEPITNFGLSYLGLEGTEGASTVFITTITNTSADTLKNLGFRVSIWVQSDVFGANMEVYRALSYGFILAPGASQTLNSTDFFNRMGTHPCRSRVTELKKQDKEDAVNTILNSGKMPTGVTTMELEVFDIDDPTGGSVKNNTVRYEVINISQINLINPGAPSAAYNEEIATIYTLTPQFTWVSDLSSIIYDPNTQVGGTDLFALSVYKVSDPAWSDDQVLNSKPIYTENIRESMLQYPPSAKQLKEDKQYAWQVVGLLKGPLSSDYNVANLKSEVFRFRIGPLDQAGSGTSDAAETIGYLRAILGPENTHYLIELQGFLPDGILIDEKAADLAALAELARQFLSDGYTINNIRVQ